MVTDTSYPHIDVAPNEPARLRRIPRVRVAQIAMDSLANGWSVEEMCRQHPYLTPAEAHAAMAYYFDHRAEVDAEIRAEWEQSQCAGTRAQSSQLAAGLRGSRRGDRRSSIDG